MFFHLARAPSTKNGIYGLTVPWVWDLQKMRQLRGLSNPGSRGATTAILWVRRADDPGDALFYGTQGGYIHPESYRLWRNDGNERDVMVFSVHSGHIYILRLGQIVTTWDVGGLIRLCIGDPVSGVDIYRLQNNRYVKIKSFKIEKSPRICPERRGDHGVVYVFDRSTGETLDELRIDPSAWVQTVTAAHCNGVTNILTAKSASPRRRIERFMSGVGGAQGVALPCPRSDDGRACDYAACDGGIPLPEYWSWRGNGTARSLLTSVRCDYAAWTVAFAVEVVLI
ncbi:hypothetical protein FB451DRAFT_1190541 [Mycena latifolia]|nr:hypothetical protein FB451DRAFT_1190541 [Mycena latifolia]